MKKYKTAVIISGNGTNLQALIDAAKSPVYPAEIVLVISNKPEAFGLKRAENAGIPTAVIDHRKFDSREAFDRAMHEKLIHSGCEIICLAGFMRLLSPWFVQQWQGKILNIHPSLLPAFRGAHAVRDALAAGAEKSGCTVHIVTDALDGGPVLAQAEVPVVKGDTVETLHSRIHETEHRLYPEALRSLVTSWRSMRSD